MRSSGQNADELWHFGDQRWVGVADVADPGVDVVRRPQRRGGRGSRTSTRRAIFHGLSRDALSTTDRAADHGADRSEDDLADRINVAFAATYSDSPPLPRCDQLGDRREMGIPTGVLVQSCAIARCAATTVRRTPW